MPAPRGRTYTPSSGPLRGQTFSAPAGATGVTAGYNAYQKALARHYGYTSYAQQKSITSTPMYDVVVQRAMRRGESARTARATARRLVTEPIPKMSKGSQVGQPKGIALGNLITAMKEEGYYAPGEDVDETDFYE